MNRRFAIGLFSWAALVAVAVVACDGDTLWPPYAQGISIGTPSGDACQELTSELSTCPDFSGQQTGFEDCTSQTTRDQAVCLVETGVDVCAFFFHFDQLSPSEQTDVSLCFQSQTNTDDGAPL